MKVIKDFHRLDVSWYQSGCERYVPELGGHRAIVDPQLLSCVLSVLPGGGWRDFCALRLQLFRMTGRAPGPVELYQAQVCRQTLLDA
jgi:hypothetical protein